MPQFVGDSRIAIVREANRLYGLGGTRQSWLWRLQITDPLLPKECCSGAAIVIAAMKLGHIPGDPSTVEAMPNERWLADRFREINPDLTMRMAQAFVKKLVFRNDQRRDRNGAFATARKLVFWTKDRPGTAKRRNRARRREAARALRQELVAC